MAHKAVQRFNDLRDYDICLVIFLFCSFQTESPSSRAMHLSPCTPCFTWQWVSPCVAIFTTCTLKHANSNTRQGSAERLCLLSDTSEELFLLSAFTSHPCHVGKKAKKFLLTRNSLKLQLTQMHTNTLILKEEGSEKAKKLPKGILLQAEKKGLSERGNVLQRPDE